MLLPVFQQYAPGPAATCVCLCTIVQLCDQCASSKMQTNLVSSQTICVEYDLLSVQQLTPKVDTDCICDSGFLAFASLSRSSAATDSKQDGDRVENRPMRVDWLFTVSADQLQSHFAWHLKQSRATYVPHKHEAADDCRIPTVARYDTLTSYPVSGLRSSRLYLQIHARTCAAQVCNQGCSRSEYLMDSEPKRNISLLHECPGVRFRLRPDTYLACSVISRSNTHEAIARWRHMCLRVRNNGRDCDAEPD